MADEKSYRDRAIISELFEQGSAAEAEIFVGYGESNKTLSEKLCRITTALQAMNKTFTGEFAGMLDDIIRHTETQYGSIGSFNRDQLIRYKAEQAKVEQKEKSGILGLFGSK